MASKKRCPISVSNTSIGQVVRSIWSILRDVRDILSRSHFRGKINLSSVADMLGGGGADGNFNPV